jgi:hypothetical protein
MTSLKRLSAEILNNFGSSSVVMQWTVNATTLLSENLKFTFKNFPEFKHLAAHSRYKIHASEIFCL